MKILAYDLATRTGWCVGDALPGSERPAFGTHTLPSTGEDIGAFLDAALRKYRQDVGVYRPDLVVFECPVLPAETQIATLRKLYGLAGVVELLCRWTTIRCAEEHLGTIKKFVTGNGHATKAEVIFAVKTFGFAVGEDDNQADAIALWLLAQSKVDLANARAAMRRWEVGTGLFAPRGPERMTAAEYRRVTAKP
jgi:Holliday junction resolvasome RuvABC endonuclease subunit